MIGIVILGEEVVAQVGAQVAFFGCVPSSAGAKLSRLVQIL